MKEINIYTDGACRGNGRENTIGGYGVVLIYKGNIKELKEAVVDTTNNKMELTAVIKGLETLKEPCIVSLFCDSAYVVNAINNNWIDKWIKNNWKNSKKEDVKNRELWEELIKLISIHKVTFIKVKGHSDNEFNNRCDKLANMAMDELNS